MLLCYWVLFDVIGCHWNRMFSDADGCGSVEQAIEKNKRHLSQTQTCQCRLHLQSHQQFLCGAVIHAEHTHSNSALHTQAQMREGNCNRWGRCQHPLEHRTERCRRSHLFHRLCCDVNMQPHKVHMAAVANTILVTSLL